MKKNIDYYSTEISNDFINRLKNRFHFKPHVVESEIYLYIVLRYLIINKKTETILNNLPITQSIIDSIISFNSNFYEFFWNELCIYSDRYILKTSDNKELLIEQNNYEIRNIIKNNVYLLKNNRFLDTNNNYSFIEDYLKLFNQNIKIVLNLDVKYKTLSRIAKQEYCIYKQLMSLNNLYLQVLFPKGRNNVEYLYYEMYYKNYRVKNVSNIKEMTVEKFLVENIDAIDDKLTVVDEQVKLDDGIIDILCKDDNDDYVIVELKTKITKSIVWQSLYYPSKLREMKNIKENENIRFIAFCPTYPNSISSVLLTIPNIELYQYKVVVDDEDNIVDIISKRFY